MKERLVLRSGTVVLSLVMVVGLAGAVDRSSPAPASGLQEPPSSFYHRGTRRNPFLPPFTLGRTEAPKLRPPTGDVTVGLRLMGILQSPGRPGRAFLNDRTLVEGQSGQFELDGHLVDVKLLRVEVSEVTVQFDGEKILIIKLQESGAPAPATQAKEKP